MKNETDGQLLSLQTGMRNLLLPCARFSFFWVGGGVRFSFSTIDGNVALPHTQTGALPLVSIILKSPRFPCKKVYIIVRFNPKPQGNRTADKM